MICAIGDTLQNCTLELATLGDLKLVERPQPIVLGPQDFTNIRASIKVASTENGVIFGNIGEIVFLWCVEKLIRNGTFCIDEFFHAIQCMT